MNAFCLYKRIAYNTSRCLCSNYVILRELSFHGGYLVNSVMQRQDKLIGNIIARLDMAINIK